MKFFGKFVAVLIGVVSASAAYALPMTTLDIDVDPGTPGIQTSRVVAVGSTFTVDINISNVSALYAYDLEVDHDPGKLNATSVTEGSFLSAGGLTFFDPSNLNPVRPIATLLAVATGVSGSGTLFSIQYTAFAAGVSPLQFFLPDLADDVGQSIPVSVNGASITVQGVPLPSTLLLLGIGLAVVAGTRRRS